MIYARTIFLVLVVSLPSLYSVAQTHFRIELSGGASFNLSSSGVFRNWGDGWTLGAGATYQLNPSIEFLTVVSYSRFPYIENNLELTAPAVVGWRQSVTGKSSNVIETSVGVRFLKSASFVNPFLAVRAGFYRFNIGEVVVSNWMDSTPQNVTRSTYRGTGISTTKGFVALGFGLSMPLDASIRITLESHFTPTLGSNERFIPIFSTIQLSLW